MPTSTTANEAPDFSLENLKLFRIIFKSATRHFHEIEKSAGVGGASLWAMAQISENTKITVSELAKSMSIHQSTASNLIEKLENSGYISRSRSNEDRRVVYLTLTETGHAVMVKAPTPYCGILPDALMKLEYSKQVELYNLLKDLLANMEFKQDGSAFELLSKI